MNNISVILNLYKRPYTFEQQIDAILNQSVSINPQDIHVWVNNTAMPVIKYDGVKVYNCNWNTKFWGRFTIPLLLDTPYIALFDDDIIPAKNWLRNCLDTIETEETNGILGGSGVILTNNIYMPHLKIGWNGQHLNEVIQVDLVGHAWFFRQEWCKYLWFEKPCMWDNGEDIMFSFLSQKYGKISTYVPSHPDDNKEIWSNDIGLLYTNDVNAASRLPRHLDERTEICRYCVNRGWKTIINKIEVL